MGCGGLPTSGTMKPATTPLVEAMNKGDIDEESRSLPRDRGDGRRLREQGNKNRAAGHGALGPAGPRRQRREYPAAPPPAATPEWGYPPPTPKPPLPTPPVLRFFFERREGRTPPPGAGR